MLCRTDPSGRIKNKSQSPRSVRAL